MLNSLDWADIWLGTDGDRRNSSEDLGKPRGTSENLGRPRKTSENLGKVSEKYRENVGGIRKRRPASPESHRDLSLVGIGTDLRVTALRTETRRAKRAGFFLQFQGRRPPPSRGKSRKSLGKRRKNEIAEKSR
eukprot:gene13423-biopygen99